MANSSPHTYTFKCGGLTRSVVTDVPLVPSEIASLQSIIDFCEEREPGQGAYALVRSIEFEWRYFSNFRKRLMTGLTNGEVSEIARKWSEHPEQECRVYEVWTARQFSQSYDLVHTYRPDRMDRDVIIKHAEQAWKAGQ